MISTVGKMFVVLAAVACAMAGPVPAQESADVRDFTWQWMEKQEPHYYDPTPEVLEGALDGPLSEVEEVVFAVRANGRDWHWYANFGYHIERPNSYKYGGRGGYLMACNLRTGETRTILADPGGDIRDPAVHYDGETILFAYRRAEEHQYHLYTIQSDGTGLTQLTEGKYDDFEPCWMPDGTIMFVSSRCRRWVPCWYSQVGIMYRCNSDGSNIRQVSAGVETENSPWPLNDGRIIYTRWEYVDRGQSEYHGLWTVNPDGTRQMVFFDNQGRGMTLYIDAKPVPDRPDVVTIISPRHGRNEHRGRIGLIDSSLGPDSEDAVRFVDRGYPAFNSEKKKGHLPGNTWRDPYPVSEDCLLAATSRSIAVMNDEGRYEPVCTLPQDFGKGLNVHEPRPLVARPREPVVADMVREDTEKGTLVLADVSVGRNMKDVEPTEVKSLLVMEEMPRPVAKCAYPDAIGLQKNYVLHRVLGTVPVYEDGSAHFKVPAGRPLFFVAQDENGRGVKRMHSFVSVMQGETTSCVGCHEHRTRTPRDQYNMSALKAVRRPADEVTPVPGVPQIFDYVRDIQPIWDRHCIKCHNNETFAGKLTLVGDINPAYSTSYSSIVHNRLTDIGSNGNRPPYDGGTGDSRLYEVLIEGHKDVELSEHEMRMIRTWIDASGTFAGTYAAIGDASRDNRVPKDLDYRVVQNRCNECHTRGDGEWLKGKEMRRRAWLFNVERPDKSLILLAPLSKEAGGLGVCTQTEAYHREPKEAPPAEVFTSKDDPDYQALKKLTLAVVDRYDDRKRWFQDGFKPRDFYVREMKRFGALPQDFEPGVDTLDPWATDRRYFEIINRAAIGQWE